MALIIPVSLFVLAAAASSSPIYSVPLEYVALSPIPENIYNQFQDMKSGEYAFGYSGGPLAREEARTADGVTHGAYSYVDAHGIVQHYRYIADADGFRVAGTNIPTVEASSHLPLRQPVDASTVEKPAFKSEENSSRKKRGVPAEAVYALPAGPLVLVGASVPAATSSQSHLQIHKSLKTKIDTPVREAIAVETVAVPAIPVEAKAIAVAASVPAATSSQSRFQIHKTLRIELSPAHAVETMTEIPAIAELPVETKTIEAAHVATPIAVAASVPLATSSQSRFQIHSGSKTEIHVPLDPIPVGVQSTEAAAGPIGVEAIETRLTVPILESKIEAVSVATPIAVAASVPLATSSQRRFQIHSSSKAVIHEALDPIPVAVETVQTSAIPTDVKTIETSPSLTIDAPASVATSTSNQTRAQIPKSDKLKFHAQSQHPGYTVLDLQPLIALHPANSVSLPSVARHPVGVGLGIVSSPLVAYNTYGTALLATHKISEI